MRQWLMQVRRICKMFSAVSSTTCGLFPPLAAPSKLHRLTDHGPRGAVLALSFKVSNRFQKSDSKDNKILNGNFPARKKVDAGGNISRFLVKAGSGIPLESGPESSLSSSPKSIWESLKYGADVFYRFLKPNVILGKIMGVLSIALLGMDNLSDFSPMYFKGILKVALAAFLITVYISGLNQLTDIEIDKVNKPYRPLATGEYSYKTASLIVAFSAILCFAIIWIEGSWPLFGLHLGYFLMGTLYSVTINFPRLRWKRSALSALVFNQICNGIAQPVSYYLHFKTHLLQKPYVFSKSLMFASALMSFFSIILTLAKDIPDVEGDRKYGVESFAMRFGQKRIFWVCVIVLQMVFSAAVCIGAMFPNPRNKLTMILGHSVMAATLWNRAKQTDITNQDSSEAFHMFLWKLLYAECLLIPFARF